MIYRDYAASIWHLITRWKRGPATWPRRCDENLESARTDCAIFAHSLSDADRARAYLRAARALVEAADELVAEATGSEGMLTSEVWWDDLHSTVDRMEAGEDGDAIDTRGPDYVDPRNPDAPVDGVR